MTGAAEGIPCPRTQAVEVGDRVALIHKSRVSDHLHVPVHRGGAPGGGAAGSAEPKYPLNGSDTVVDRPLALVVVGLTVMYI